MYRCVSQRKYRMRDDRLDVVTDTSRDCHCMSDCWREILFVIRDILNKQVLLRGDVTLRTRRCLEVFRQWIWRPRSCENLHLIIWYVGSCILIRSKKMQQYAGIYLLQNHSTYFGCPSHPSSGVHKTVTEASGTGIWATTFLQRGQLASLEEGCYSDTMTCIRSCS